MIYAIIGQPFTVNAEFKNDDGTPFAVTTNVIYKVYDFNDTFILQGSAIQDSLLPTNWYANFTLPVTAPVPDDMSNQQYWIEFEALSPNLTIKSKLYFQVLSQAEPESHDSNIVILDKNPVIDTLITQFPITSYSVKITDEYDNQLYTATFDSPTSTLINNEYITQFNSNDFRLSAGEGMFPYLVIYTYTMANGHTNTEIHPVYVMNSAMMLAVNDMRMYLDKARNYDIDPSLRWTDAELAHFLMSGLQRFNTANPSITGFNIMTYPKQMFYMLVKLAEYEALNALYLAEGMRSFSFSGASTTLEVNRTQYIQTKMDEIGRWIDSNLTNAKTLLMKRLYGAGVNGISLTSVTNRIGYNWRSPMYIRMLNNL